MQGLRIRGRLHPVLLVLERPLSVVGILPDEHSGGVGDLPPVSCLVKGHHRVVEDLVGPGHAYRAALLVAGLLRGGDERGVHGDGHLGEGVVAQRGAVRVAADLVAEGPTAVEVAAGGSPGQCDEERVGYVVLHAEVCDAAGREDVVDEAEGWGVLWEALLLLLLLLLLPQVEVVHRLLHVEGGRLGKPEEGPGGNGEGAGGGAAAADGSTGVSPAQHGSSHLGRPGGAVSVGGPHGDGVAAGLGGEAGEVGGVDSVAGGHVGVAGAGVS